MRSLGSLLRGGYIPEHGQQFYQAYSEVPSLRFRGYEKLRRKKQFSFEPGNHDSLDKYYLWPYFPNLPIRAVVLNQNIPFFTKGKEIPLVDGVLSYQDYISYNQEVIYLFPTFFKPVY